MSALPHFRVEVWDGQVWVGQVLVREFFYNLVAMQQPDLVLSELALPLAPSYSLLPMLFAVLYVAHLPRSSCLLRAQLSL